MSISSKCKGASMKKPLALTASLLLLAGCAGSLPPTLRDARVSQVTVAAAHAHQAPAGVHVRWGGVISKINNTPKATWVQIISKPLRHSGRPRRVRFSEGRFLARVPGFLDPDVYAVGRKITVVGVFSGYEKDPIGSYLYDFPVVRTHAIYLWPPRPRRRYYYGSPWALGIGLGPAFGWGWRRDYDDGPGFWP